MINIAVFASGNGSNFEAIVKAAKSKKIKGAAVKLLVCDRQKAFAIQRAKRLKIPIFYINPKKFPSKKDFEKEIVNLLKREKISLVVLAGFMRILSSYFIRHYKNKILNIHPALLPSFKGAKAIKDAYNYGVGVSGVTVHFVTEDVDGGPIISQEAVKIEKKDTLKSLEEKIHLIEHRLYPQAINTIINKRDKIRGRRVIIED